VGRIGRPIAFRAFGEQELRHVYRATAVCLNPSFNRRKVSSNKGLQVRCGLQESGAVCSLVCSLVFNEVPIRVAILHEFARHSRYKAKDNFPCCSKVLERGYHLFIYIRETKRLVVELE